MNLDNLQTTDALDVAGKRVLVRADLNDANLGGADLERVKLWGARLRRVNLEDANLKGATDTCALNLNHTA